MVAMIVFAIISIAFVGLFINAINQQRQILNLNNLLNNVSYSMEYMDRAIRMAQKDLTGDCLGGALLKYNYATASPAESIRFLNYDGKCLEFYKSGEQLMMRRSTSNLSSQFQAPEALTPTELSVKGVQFNVIGDGQGLADQRQPKIVIGLIMETKEIKPQQLIVQTTTCQRNPNYTQ